MSRPEPDPLLDALGAAARAEQADAPDAAWDRLAADPAWDRLAADEPAAELGLDGLADADPDAHAAAREAFAPLPAEARGRFLAAALAAFDAADPDVAADGPVPGPRPPRGVQVLPFRRTLLGRALTWGGPALLAAAALAVLWVPSPAPAPLPPYDLEVSGGAQALRGPQAATAVTRLGPGDALALTLVPDVAAEGPLQVRAWLAPDGGAPRPWPVTPEVGPTGAQRIQGSREALGLGDWPAGRYTLVIAVGRPEALPAAAPAAAPPADAGWQRLTWRLELR